jgi:anti-sigma-K factor RskA
MVESNSENIHVAEELAAYALGVLEPDEAAAVSQHFERCPACQAELASYEAVVGRLAQSVPSISPAPELKQRLLARIWEARSTPAAPLSWFDRIRQWLTRPMPTWQVGLVSALLVIVVMLVLLSGSGQPGNFAQVALAATENAPGATGILVISADGEYGSLVVQGLPDLSSEQQYQLWLIDDGERTSGGVFSVHEGYAALQIYSLRALGSYEAFGITIEPAGGSPGPTGAKVLGSS